MRGGSGMRLFSPVRIVLRKSTSFMNSLIRYKRLLLPVQALRFSTAAGKAGGGPSGKSGAAAAEKLNGNDGGSTGKAENSEKKKEDQASPPPPPPPPPPPRSKVLVLGGNGFVGNAVCMEALSRGFEVAAMSRSGRPEREDGWISDVEWIKSDALEPDSYVNYLSPIQSIVSCIGAFGSYKYAYEINGTANIRAARAANENGVERFVFISVKQYKYIESVPPMNGYFQGKRAAEEEIQKLFPNHSTILRPGMIYGERYAGKRKIPLQLIGQPLAALTSLSPIKSLAKYPIFQLTLTQPLPVETVARNALRAAIGEETRAVLEIDDMK
ncbi:hypothetical protein NDN08_007085 [Rhodosorus marinus]|uniref:NAD(P)-binding domain-containing protein n=1 Tax=Rhodosorus marinus TaxID=101924 RepID=A0AAV8UFI8_9RHOD|nr:hypothetical protein NDN08_007085 [Rhodosorus marinus]